MYSKEEAKQLRMDFWDGFGRHSKRLKHLRKQNRKWIFYHTGIKHLELKFEVERHVVRVMMELNHRIEWQRIDVFEQLEHYKKLIEAHFDVPLVWDFLFTTETGKEVCRIYTESTGFDYHRREQWPMIYKFMSDYMIRMELAFTEIKDVLREPESL